MTRREIHRIAVRMAFCAATAVVLFTLTGCAGGSNSRALVTGRIVWSGAKPFASRAALRIQLRDVSVADGDAPLLAEQVRTDVPFDAGVGDGLRFTLFGETRLDSRRLYHVSVRVDTNGDGRVGVGDYVSETLNYVPVSGDPPSVVVEATELEPCGTPDSGGFCADGPGPPL